MIMLVIFLRVFVTETEHRDLPLMIKLRKVDFVGTVLFLGAICCLVLALQWGGQTMPWSSSKIIGLLVSFGVIIAVFGIAQYHRGDDALTPLPVLRQRSILVGSVFLFFIGMFNYVVRLGAALLDPSLLTLDLSILTTYHFISRRPRMSLRYPVVSESSLLYLLRLFSLVLLVH